MANKTINDLSTELTTPASDDKLPIWDTSAAATKWITTTNLGTGGGGGGSGGILEAASYASLSAAVTAIGSTPSVLRISTALYPNGANVTVPATLTLQFVGAGTLTLTTGQTVTILSDPSGWPLQKIFFNATAGLGTISFAGNKLLKETYPEWWGAVKDGTTNDAASMVAALVAAATCSATMRLGIGDYYRATSVIQGPTTANGKVSVKGAGKGLTRLTCSNSAITTLEFRFTGASAKVTVSDLSIIGPTGLGFDNNSFGISFITAAIGHKFRAERVEVTGTHDHAIFHSGGGTEEVVDCDLEASDVVVSAFESTGAADSASFYARGGTWGTPNGDLSSAGSVGLYVHPHVPYIVEGVTFKSLGRYGIYQNGSPGTARKYAKAIGCAFIDCEMAQTKGTGQSVFEGCTVNGSSSGLGSSLGGRVIITGGSYERTLLSTGALDSDLKIFGAVVTDSRLVIAASNLHHLKVGLTKFIVTDSYTFGGAIITLGGTNVLNYADLDDVVLHDQTTTAAYQAFITFNGATLRASRLRTLGTSRATLGVMYVAGSTTCILDNCDIDGSINLVSGGPPVDTVGGSNNFFRGTGHFTGGSTLQQRFVRRAGVNPVSVASATTIDTNTTAFLNYDTHVVTGAAAIATLSSPHPCTGVIRLVVAAAGTWSTASSGNITPLTTAARAAGVVVTLLWEPLAAKWLEVASPTVVSIGIPIGDESTAITTGTAKTTFRMPHALTLTAVRASLTTASSSGIPTFDINEGGVSILSTKLTIDASEKTSTTAVTAAVISDTALADDAEITIDVDVAGTGAAGAKIWLIGTR